MPIPKKVERKTLYQDKMDYKGLDINDIIKYGADIEQERGWNERHDIAEKREEAIKEIYNEIFEQYIPLDKMDEANFKLIDLLTDGRESMGKDMLKEQSPNEELKSEMKERGEG